MTETAEAGTLDGILVGKFGCEIMVGTYVKVI